MKALSIKQPWADYILFHGKDVENRKWAEPLRKVARRQIGQRIQIHAGKLPDGEYDGPAERLGAILGEVTIAGCVTESQSGWWQGPFGLVLSDPIAYEKPLPCRGMLGFFEPRIGEAAR